MGEENVLALPWTMEPSTVLPGWWVVYDNDGNTITGGPRCYAVAALIRFAADLLAACKAALEELRLYMGTLEVCRQCQAAIDRAAGKEKEDA